MLKKIPLSLLFTFFVSLMLAQDKFTVSGSVKDIKTGEELIGASIRLKEKPSVGTVTNEYGFFSLTLDKGSYTLLIDFIGYTQVERVLVLDKNQKLDISIGEMAKQLDEVVVSAQSRCKYPQG